MKPALETECQIHAFYAFWSSLANSEDVFFDEPQIWCQARHRSEKYGQILFTENTGKMIRERG